MLRRLFLTLAALVLAGAARAAPPLVDGAWLQARLGDPDVVIVDMSGDETQYRRFHIPGAVHLPFGALVQRGRDGVVLRVPDARIFALLGQLGIRRESHVVVYDDIGALNAGRLFWELERIGHPKVSVLDGGLVRWILDGRPVTQEVPAPRPAVYRAEGGGRDNEIAHEAVRRLVDEGGAVLLDVRSEAEYVGDPRQPRSGHIPGARFWPWDTTVRWDAGFVLEDPATLEASLAALGIRDKDTPIVTYCRSGHRASQAYFVLRRLGFTRVRLYDGSMLQWSRDPQAPLKRGRAP
ncbi:sulfurtransferase [Inmirania thermothiophila]|uniref:Thiosulfate/3-mercaptopyruvate sulfurtransferase n=1 Tax=Inmirania thermothiophila TaxID=1750597 RepID=A0A3N1Y5W2_9GAMM|nr:sulfurtransferase [Inmirania thermothiophila]ROR32687.1 thiosulfate/3-mercaptopyruvate sulfurtransferase [Inmirania thermothiophila]